MLIVVYALLLQVKDDVSHVGKEANDRFHYYSVDEGDLEGGLGVLVIVKGFANLVNPELKTKEEASEAFFLEDAHCFFFVSF